MILHYTCVQVPTFSMTQSTACIGLNLLYSGFPSFMLFLVEGFADSEMKGTRPIEPYLPSAACYVAELGHHWFR